MRELDSWAVELAEEARGQPHDAGNGDWRIGDSRSLIIHSGCWFYDFALGKGGRGALALIAFLHDIGADEAGKIARAWLADHSGEGRLNMAPMTTRTQPARPMTSSASPRLKPCGSTDSRSRARLRKLISPAAV